MMNQSGNQSINIIKHQLAFRMFMQSLIELQAKSLNDPLQQLFVISLIRSESVQK